VTDEPCVYCDEAHEPRYLCDPARRVLDALKARGMSFNMPTIEFPEAIPLQQMNMGLDRHDVLVGQLVVLAGTVPVADTVRPTVVFTGRSVYGDTLPRWVYPATPADLSRMVKLVQDMTTLAIRTAAKGNRP
jgi:hypothetical protein